MNFLLYIGLFAVLLTNTGNSDNDFNDPDYRIYRHWDVWKIYCADRNVIRQIDNINNVDVVNVTSDYIEIYADREAIDQVKQINPDVQYNRHLVLDPVDYGYYHTWSQVLSEVATYIANHSTIACCDTIGYSVQNRPIISIKISDNVNNDELEGKIQFNGCHHGDENIATEINLYFMRYLLDNYGIIPEVTSLVNHREIFIIPVVNPDGFNAGYRYNANGVDLNRDYGFQWFGEGSSSSPFSQLESRAMRDDYCKYGYTISLDYHSVSSYVNYLWDYSTYQVPDYYEEVVMFSVPYADSTGYDTINGYSWYQISGSCQDATYGLFGTLDVTIESQQPSDPDPECLKNRGAMMYVATLAGYGIQGYVTDSITGVPLEAVMFFNQGTDPRWITNSRNATGEYHKILAPGTYTVTAHVPGYISKTESVQIYTDTVVQLDFHLSANSECFAIRLLAARQEYSSFINSTYAFDALGPVDGNFMSLNRDGFVILDFGEDNPIIDKTGYDLVVHEGNDGVVENCEVYAGNSPEFSQGWSLLGIASGTDSFDLSSVGLQSARYVKIVDDYSNTSGSTPGYDLDAVTHQSLLGISEHPGEIPTQINFQLVNNVGNSPFLKFVLPHKQQVEFTVSDISGRIISSTSNIYPAGHHFWTPLSIINNQLSSGIYFLHADFQSTRSTFKLEILN
jgi:hypothetical protein